MTSSAITICTYIHRVSNDTTSYKRAYDSPDVNEYREDYFPVQLILLENI